MEVKRIEGYPRDVVEEVQAVLDKWAKAKVIARPFEIQRLKPENNPQGYIVVILSPFADKDARKLFFRCSNNPQNYVRGKLFNPSGGKWFVIDSEGHEWFFGTSISETQLLPEVE